MIALTLVWIFFVVWKFEVFKTADLLLSVAVCTAAWCSILEDVWKLSKRGEKAVNVVSYSVFLPSLVAALILSDMLLWQKIVYPLGGGSFGFGVNRLVDYMGAKRQSRHSSKEGD